MQISLDCMNYDACVVKLHRIYLANVKNWYEEKRKKESFIYLKTVWKDCIGQS